MVKNPYYKTMSLYLYFHVDQLSILVESSTSIPSNIGNPQTIIHLTIFVVMWLGRVCVVPLGSKPCRLLQVNLNAKAF